MNHVFSVSRTQSIETSTNGDAEVAPPSLVAPANTPLGGGQGNNASALMGETVNVVSDFYWTYSKLKEARQEVPRIILTEKKLKTNALVSQLKYSYGVTKDSINAALDKLPEDTKNNIINVVKGTKDTVAAQQVGGKTLGDQLKDKFDFLQDDNNIFDTNPYLRPYRDLYITEPTGWEFHLPYFDNYNNSQQNAFSNDAPNPFLGILKKGAEMLTDVASIASILRGPASISFVEKSKFYNYSEEGEEFSFSFPLINTGSVTFDDVVRNWELLFLILYNNKPSRRNTSLIDPPAIYQVEIPGVKFLPFCYISSIAVEFQGSRRELTFDLSYIDNLNVDAAMPVANNVLPGITSVVNKIFNSPNIVRGFSNTSTPRSITAIIPDAYNIKISVKSLIAESKNFMYSVLNGKQTVTTSTKAAQVVNLVRNIVGR
jgi:hypothetical protein